MSNELAFFEPASIIRAALSVHPVSNLSGQNLPILISESEFTHLIWTL